MDLFETTKQEIIEGLKKGLIGEKIIINTLYLEYIGSTEQIFLKYEHNGVWLADIIPNSQSFTLKKMFIPKVRKEIKEVDTLDSLNWVIVEVDLNTYKITLTSEYVNEIFQTKSFLLNF